MQNTTGMDIDDRWVGALTVRKVIVRHRADQRLELQATVCPIADKAEFSARSLDSVAC